MLNNLSETIHQYFRDQFVTLEVEGRAVCFPSSNQLEKKEKSVSLIVLTDTILTGFKRLFCQSITIWKELIQTRSLGRLLEWML